MNCQEFWRISHGYLLGPADLADHPAALEHLSGCAQCRGKLDAQQRFRRQVERAMGTTAVPHDLRAKVVAALDRVSPAPTTPRIDLGRWKFVPLAAAAIIGAALLTRLLLPSGQPPPGPGPSVPAVDWFHDSRLAAVAPKVVGAHQKCCDQPHHHLVSLGPAVDSNLPSIARQLKPKAQVPVAAPDLTAYGFRFVGALLCIPGVGVRGAHLIYADTRRPSLKISIYSVRDFPRLASPPAQCHSRISQAEAAGREVLAWVIGPTHVVMVANVPPTRLAELVTAVNRSLGRAAARRNDCDDTGSKRGGAIRAAGSLAASHLRSARR